MIEMVKISLFYSPIGDPYFTNGDIFTNGDSKMDCIPICSKL